MPRMKTARSRKKRYWDVNGFLQRQEIRHNSNMGFFSCLLSEIHRSSLAGELDRTLHLNNHILSTTAHLSELKNSRRDSPSISCLIRVWHWRLSKEGRGMRRYMNSVGKWSKEADHFTEKPTGTTDTVEIFISWMLMVTITCSACNCPINELCYGSMQPSELFQRWFTRFNHSIHYSKR